MLGVWDFQAVNHLVFEYIFSNSSKDLLVIIYLFFKEVRSHLFTGQTLTCNFYVTLKQAGQFRCT